MHRHTDTHTHAVRHCMINQETEAKTWLPWCWAWCFISALYYRMISKALSVCVCVLLWKSAPGRGGRWRGWAIFSRLFRSSHLLWSTVSRAVPWWWDNTLKSGRCYIDRPAGRKWISCLKWISCPMSKFYLFVWLSPCSRWSWRWRLLRTEWVLSCIPERQRHGCRCHGSAGTEANKLSWVSVTVLIYNTRHFDLECKKAKIGFSTGPTRWIMTSRTSTQPLSDSTSKRANMAFPTLSKLKLRGLALEMDRMDISVTGCIKKSILIQRVIK